MGKGGVGKSTLAAATAVRDARSGRRVLLVSTDQAHSLGDVLGVVVAPTGSCDPVRVTADLPVDDPGQGGFLDALALDTLALLEAQWQQACAPLAGKFPESDLGDVAPEELSAFPGIQEVLGLREVTRLAESGDWDHVVVDCASTADALRMLTLPSAFALYLERAWPRHRRLSIAPGDAHSVAVVELLERTAGSLERLSTMITGAGGDVGAHLVLTAERVVAAEAVRTLTSLALMGVDVRELIVNHVLVQDDSYEYRNLPAHPAFDWYAERIAEQQSVLDELGTGTGEAALVLVPHLAGEPIGPKALVELLDCTRRRGSAPPPGPLRAVVDLESGSGLDSVYRLRLQLPPLAPAALGPSAARETLSLGRVDDDLIVAVGGLRRRVRLASVLRRCQVAGAQFKDDELTVRFRPDPAVWPK